MEEIVASERTVGRMLALLPAVVVGVCVSVLTLVTTPLPARVAAAAVIAAACWTAYRLLTARITVDGDGIVVRGVFYDGDISWAALHGVDVVPVAAPVRLLPAGIRPHVIEIRGEGWRLRPVATVGALDDRPVRLVLGALRAYHGAVTIPAQRRAAESATRV